MRSPTLRALGAIALAGLMTACADDGTGPAADGTTRLDVQLTDAPGDFVSAVVTIEEVYLQGDTRVVLMDDAVTTNLLDLSNDAITLVNDAEVESGTYQELRFVISGGYIEVEQADGSTKIYASQGYTLPAGMTADGTLHMPSLGQSGLKVNFDGGLTIDGVTESLLVDFDVAQSFGLEAGNSGRWVMRPVVKGAKSEAAAGVRVSLALGSGVTLPAIGGVATTMGMFKARLTDDNGNAKEASFVSSNGAWVARFPYLLPDTEWNLSVVGPAGLTFTTDPVLPLELTATGGATVEKNIVIKTAALP